MEQLFVVVAYCGAGSRLSMIKMRHLSVYGLYFYSERPGITLFFPVIDHQAEYESGSVWIMVCYCDT